jgi:hypothetical protein
MTPDDPDEIVTFHGTAHDGAKLEIEMPRWALAAIGRGQAVTWRGGLDWTLLIDDAEMSRAVTPSAMSPPVLEHVGYGTACA